MLAGWEEEASRRAPQGAEPQRVILSPGEYPGSLPGRTEILAAERLRQEGNVAYGDGRFEEAVSLYSSSAVLNPSDHLVYSNRSACFVRMGRPIEALDDAMICVSLAPTFARGFLRKGFAEQLLNRRVDAQASYRRGLSHDPKSQTLLQALRNLQSESGGGLQATFYHVLFVSPHLQMDRLFQVLEDTDRLTSAYVEDNKAELDAQFACLTQTLRVDLGLLLASPVLRDAYDRVTFACGQLLQWAPEAVSKHLTQARRIVEGLGLALRCGWSIHHGVAKFSANALTILATSDGASDELRREATRLLLGGLLRWLLDPTPEPESPPENRDVCGCTFLSPRLSAATWLERLFEHGTRSWVREECERFPGVVPLAVHLCLVVRDERAVPLGLPCLLRLPAVARAVMECEVVIDLTTCSRDTMGRREGRRWLTRQRGKAAAAGGGNSGSDAPAGGVHSPASLSPAPSNVPTTPPPHEGAPSSSSQTPRSPPMTAPTPGSAMESGVSPSCAVCGGSGEVAEAPDVATSGAAQGLALRRLVAPAQRLGEWLMASLGYLLVFVDDDALFSAHACSALSRLAHAVPGGVARLTEGVWVGLPMLERLSILACQHTAALELLETLARHSPSARSAMSSLAAALSVSTPPQKAPPSRSSAPALMPPAAGAVSAGVAAELVASPPAPTSPRRTKGISDDEEAEPAKRRKQDGAGGADVDMSDAAPGGSAASSSEAVRDKADVGEESASTDATGTAEPESEHEHEGLGEPTWVECYNHELHDELWIQQDDAEATQQRQASGEGKEQSGLAPGGRQSSSSSTSSSSSSAAPVWPRTAAPPFHGVVSLGNFAEVAWQVPVAGRLTPLGSRMDTASDDDITMVEATPATWEMPAVPAVWNRRFDDFVSARIEMDEPHVDLGTFEWQAGKEGCIVLLLRSSIQRSPATPDWAAAVWLCAEVGARAAIVANDLPDDGPNQPAFRMGLFGSTAPPIPAFMVGGKDGESLRAAVQAAQPAHFVVAVKSVRSQGREIEGTTEPEASPEGSAADVQPSHSSPPPWPLVLRTPQDVAQAWSLVETVNRAAPSPQQAAALDVLAQRMGLPEKRIWLTRRLQRHHRGDTDADDPVEPPLAFVECDREADQLQQLRRQRAERMGLAAPDITGEFEVRFRDESSVGSAVVREWMDIVAKQAFLPRSHRLLISYDNGVTFLPDPAALFLNPCWQGDFEMLGRLLGLALWHQVTLDLPLHPYVCELLLAEGASVAPVEDRGAAAALTSPLEASPSPSDFAEDAERLKSIDEELHRHKVQWLMTNDVGFLGFDLPFTDTLLAAATGGQPQAAGAADASATSSSSPTASADGPASAASPPAAAPHPVEHLEPLPEVVSPSDALLGEAETVGPMRLRAFHRSGAQITLAPAGEHAVVSEGNKGEFVTRLLRWRLRGALRGPVAAMARGLRAVVPAAVLAEAHRMLSAEEVHGLLCGMRGIDVEDWEKNTRTVGGLNSSSREVRWFWKILRQWAAEGHQERLQDLLQFATGSRRVPVGGFAQLVGFNGGRHLFTLAKGVHLSSQALPTSHACICTMDLPPWDSFEAASAKLFAALAAGRGRFDEGPAAAGTAAATTATDSGSVGGPGGNVGPSAS